MIINFSSGAKDQTQFSVSISVFANWIGGGAGGPSPTVTIQDIFCHPFTQQSDFEQFVSDFNAAIADPSTFSASDQAFLDLYDDGTIGYDDRDAWLHYLLQTNGFDDERLSFADPTPTTFAESDPLGLRLGRTNEVIIIDPQNINAIKVTRATNNCTDQSGTPLGSPNLWSGDTYLQTLWYDLNSLDELNRQETGLAAVRRFPTSGGEITFYIRGGSQTLDQGSIGLCRNNAAWTKPTKIIIRGYPGETPTLKCGSKLITSGLGAGQYDIRFEGGGQFQFRNRRSNVEWDAATIRGYRDGVGSTRIYCVGVFYVEQTDPDASAVENCTFRNMRITDILGTSTAGTYLDSGWDRYDEIFGLNVDSELAANGAIVLSHGLATKMYNCVCEVAPADFPMTENQVGEGIILNKAGSIASRVTLTGLTPHNGLGIAGDGSIVEYCDLENYHDTPLGVGAGTGITVRYNRIHMTTHEAKLAYGVQVTPASGTSSGSFIGNVFWDWQFNGGLVDGFNSGILFSCLVGGTTINGWEVTDNIFYGCGTTLYDNGVTNTVRNIDQHDNVYVDVPLWNKANYPLRFDAICLIGLAGDLVGQSFWGNKIRDNLIYRTDGGTNLAARIAFPLTTPSTYYNLAGLNALPNCSGNTSADPMFLDPDNGNFTFTSGASPVYDQFNGSEVPLLPFSEIDLLYGVCPNAHVCCTVNVSPQYVVDVNVSPRYLVEVNAGPRYTVTVNVNAGCP